MKRTKTWSALLLITLIITVTGCEKKTIDEQPKNAELLFNLDEEGNKDYYISGCDNLDIDTTKRDDKIYVTFSGCGNSFTYLTDSLHYNCYPTYDYWGYYLYDDCFWENYIDVDIESDSLILNFSLF